MSTLNPPSYPERLDTELNDILLLNEALSVTKKDVIKQKKNFEGVTFPELKEAESLNENKSIVKRIIIDKGDLEGIRAFINITRINNPNDGPGPGSINESRTKKILESTEELNGLKLELEVLKNQHRDLLKIEKRQNQDINNQVNNNMEINPEKLEILKEIEAQSSILKKLCSLLPPDQQIFGDIKDILKDSKDALSQHAQNSN